MLSFSSWYLRAHPQHLHLGRVQSQSTRAELGLDIIETAGKTVNRSRHIGDWRADVDLTVICILHKDGRGSSASPVLWPTGNLSPKQLTAY